MNRIARLLRTLVLPLVGVALGAPVASAADVNLNGITRIVGPSPNFTQVNLTTDGPIDWAYWNPTGSNLAAPVAPNNRKLGGTSISGLTNVGGSSLRGSASSTTLARYNWTDGTSPATGTSASLAGLIFNNQLGTAGDGNGMSLTLTPTSLATHHANLYFGGFGATANLTLTLNGATTVVDSSQVFGQDGPKQLAVYHISFRPDSLADKLTIEYTASNITDATNGHVGVQAVTVSPIPEPGAIALVGVGTVLVLARRRRTRA